MTRVEAISTDLSIEPSQTVYTVPGENLYYTLQNKVTTFKTGFNNIINNIRETPVKVEEVFNVQQFYERSVVYAAPVILPVINLGIHMTQAKDGYSNDDKRYIAAGVGILLLGLGIRAATRRRKSTASHGENRFERFNTDDHGVSGKLTSSKAMKGTKKDCPYTKGDFHTDS